MPADVNWFSSANRRRWKSVLYFSIREYARDYKCNANVAACTQRSYWHSTYERPNVNNQLNRVFFCRLPLTVVLEIFRKALWIELLFPRSSENKRKKRRKNRMNIHYVDTAPATTNHTRCVMFMTIFSMYFAFIHRQRNWVIYRSALIFNLLLGKNI